MIIYKKNMVFLLIFVVGILSYSIVFAIETSSNVENSNGNVSVRQWINKVDVDPVKEWTIKFNMELSIKSIGNAVETYYLNISKDLKSKGKIFSLKEEVQMKFTIQSNARVVWNLTWSDEFSAEDGSPADAAKWRYNISGNGKGKSFNSVFTLPNKEAFSEEYHIYAIEWDADGIRYFVDDSNYYTVSKSDLSKENYI